MELRTSYRMTRFGDSIAFFLLALALSLGGATMAWAKSPAPLSAPKVAPKVHTCAPYEGDTAAVSVPSDPTPLNPKTLKGLEGSYQFLPDLMLTIKRKGDQLFAGLGNDTAELFDTGSGRFFMKEDNLQMVFQLSAKGQATCLIVIKEGNVKPLPRVD